MDDIVYHKEFLSHLKLYLQTFVEFKNLHHRTNKALQEMNHHEINACQKKESTLSVLLSNQKELVRPHLERWSTLEASEKNSLLDGEIGNVLKSIEAIAHEINTAQKEMHGGPPNTYATSSSSSPITITDPFGLS